MNRARFEVATAGSVTTISFDDGGMNLLSSEALSELWIALDDVPRDTRVLVFRSSHPSIFAAGADMQEMSLFSAEESGAFSRQGQELFERIERLSCSTVALVDGDCFGGALDLVLSFDFRLATSRSRFSHPGGRIGIVTGFGGTSRWRRILAPPVARRLFLGNAILNASEALLHELVDEVLESFDGREAELVSTLASRSPSESHFVKELMRVPGSIPARELHLFAERLGQLYLGTTGESEQAPDRN